MGANNAAEMIRLGRLTAPHRTPFDVVQQGRVHSLRRYRSVERAEGEGLGTPIVLVPPLMVTSEIYDMAPDLSAVSYMLGQGVDVWLVDFGVPERTAGGMSRTLDDHVLAVSSAIDFVREKTGRDIHLGGYSQGGMFCYQVAAYRGGEGIRSVITFGSPVDIHRGFPVPIGDELAEKVLGGLRLAIEQPLAHIEGLPGSMTSVLFKMVSPRKELGQLVDFVRKLHDRTALEKRESRRRFLGGEGFVAWPGPALRTFIDEFIVANRMASGGFVIDGRTVSLADLTCPILAFVGLGDDIAKPEGVRAIRAAAFRSDVREVAVPAGHLGIVVGSRALGITWPSTVEWMRWVEGAGPLPKALATPDRERVEDVEDFDALDLDLGDLLGFATGGIERAIRRFTHTLEDAGDRVDNLRWQLPRLNRLRAIRSDTRVSLGRELAERAADIPDRTFFLWKGRAFTYADADRRVDAVVRGLIQCGVRPGQRVGVWMDVRPSYLSIVAAINRLGAIAVLLGPDSTRVALERAITLGGVEVLVTDQESAPSAKKAFDGPVLVLGGPFGDERRLPKGVIDMEAIDPETVELPDWYEANPGVAKDLALVLFTAGRGEEPRAARITNRRWAFSALGAAAACTLKPTDTVYCALPLHHAAGMLVAVGGALASGARLAVAPRFRPEHFWGEVRRYGATVVFYAGEMCRELVDAPPDAADARNPVRLVSGSGMRIDVWERMQTRFEVGVLEFYASTEGNAVLANASGEKVGSLGRALPGATAMTLVSWDWEKDAPARDASGRVRRAAIGEPGVLIARVDPRHPMAGFDGYVDSNEPEERILSDVEEPGDRWFLTGDLMRCDVDGDHWFVDRLADAVRTGAGPVFTREVEDALYRLDDVRRCAVYGVASEPGAEPAVVASLVPRRSQIDLERLAAFVREKLAPRDRPHYVRILDEIPTTDGYRPQKRDLVDYGLATSPGQLFRLDGDSYVKVAASSPPKKAKRVAVKAD